MNVITPALAESKPGQQMTYTAIDRLVLNGHDGTQAYKDLLTLRKVAPSHRESDTAHEALTFLVQTAIDFHNPHNSEAYNQLVILICSEQVTISEVVDIISKTRTPERDLPEMAPEVYRAAVTVITAQDFSFEEDGENALQFLLQRNFTPEQITHAVKIARIAVNSKDALVRSLDEPAEFRRNRFWESALFIQHPPTVQPHELNFIWTYVANASELEDHRHWILAEVRRNLHYRTREAQETGLRIMAIVSGTQLLADRLPTYQFIFQCAFGDGEELSRAAEYAISHDEDLLRLFLMPEYCDKLVTTDLHSRRAFDIFLAASLRIDMPDRLKLAIIATIQTTLFDTAQNEERLIALVRSLYPDRLQTDSEQIMRLILSNLNRQIAADHRARAGLLIVD